MSVLPRSAKIADASKGSQRKWRLPWCVIALAGSFGLPACTAPPATPPGYAVVGLESGPITLDPRFATEATASQIGDLLFEGLTRVDAQALRQPQLATAWDMPDDHTYVFRLRDNVWFADGRPLTSADVKATYDSVLQPQTSSPKRQSLGPLDAVEALDPRTVRFRLREPFPPFLDATGLGILPAHQIAATPQRPLSQPMGAGAFRLVAFIPDDAVVMARNPHHAMGAEHLAGVIFHVVPDATTRLLELKRGTLDLVQNGIEPDSLRWLQSQPHITLMTGAGTAVQYLGLNVDVPPLDDLRVRRALAYAIDRPAILTTVLKGLGSPATGLLVPTHWAYNGDVARYDYDPERAKQLLDAAGYPDPDGDGPTPRLRLSYKTTTVELRRRIAEVLQDQLRKVGIGLDIRSFEWATFYDDIKHGNFQVYSLAWVGIEDPDIYYLAAHSSQVPPAGSNRGRFRDAQVDRLTVAARRTLNLEERRQLYVEVQRRVAEVLPVVPLWWTTNIVAMNHRLHGFKLEANGSYVSLQDAWIEDR